MIKKRKPLVLAILDGWGVGEKDKRTNAIYAANTPFFDHVSKEFPHTILGATGTDVGLEENQMSGSEAGHINIGAGRIVTQDVRIILESIDSGSFFNNSVFLGAVNNAKKFSSNIHLVGLMGNNDSPHAHPDIALALLILLKRHDLKGRVFLHLFTDGRDSFPKSSLELWRKWGKVIENCDVAKLATVSGRFFGMDRAKNWDRLMKSYEAMVSAKGEKFRKFEEIIESNYKRGNTDEYIEPAVLIENGKPVGQIKNNDSVIFFNFRSDRARQFSKLFVGTKTENEIGFPKRQKLKNIFFVAMTNFGPDLDLQTAFTSSPLSSTLPTALSQKKQLYISETEKFAHVTYFINGGYADVVAGEDRILISSPKVRSYAEKPEMSSSEITDVICKNIEHDIYDVIVLNYPNSDMVAHTGDFAATVKGIEAIDKCLKRIYKVVEKREGFLVLTADHGNADIMYDKKEKRVFTFHTKNPVPFVLVSSDSNLKGIKLEQGILGNISPTILDILQLEKPKEMMEGSLIKR